MIDKKTSKSLIKAIGKKHMVKLLEFADSKNMPNPYSNEESRKQVFSFVLHGKRESPEIEQIILDCAEFHQKEREAQNRRMKRITERVNKTA